MLAEQRRKRILHEVQVRGSAHVHDLAELLAVSAMTVRRDLKELEEQGLLTRVHGGAEAAGSGLEPAFAEKSGLNARAKDLIADAAARLVEPGMSVGFSAGTTCRRLAQHVTKRTDLQDLSVVTNSLPAADEFFRTARGGLPGGPAPVAPPSRVLLTGGQRTPSDALVGPLADAALAELHVDLVFMGTHGADPRGLSTPNPDEARTNRALIRSARDVVAVFDSSKWGLTGLSGFAHWDAVDTVITDSGLSDPALQFLKDNVNKVVIAS